MQMHRIVGSVNRFVTCSTERFATLATAVWLLTPRHHLMIGVHTARKSSLRLNVNAAHRILLITYSKRKLIKFEANKVFDRLPNVTSF